MAPDRKLAPSSREPKGIPYPGHTGRASSPGKGFYATRQKLSARASNSSFPNLILDFWALKSLNVPMGPEHLSGPVVTRSSAREAREPLSIFFVATIAALLALDCFSQGISWVPILREDLEFSVTSAAGGVTLTEPSTIAGGYDGAYVFAAPPWYWGIGQTFNVPSTRLLQSIQLRVGGMNNIPASGQFEIAIYQFDTAHGTSTTKLAGVLANAADYWGYDLVSVPVSSFDFSKFGLVLNANQTYGLAICPTANYSGGSLTLQCGLNVYPDGNSFLLYVPEPGAASLFAVGLLGAALRGKHPHSTFHNLPRKRALLPANT